jgi:hypothetical protein
LSFLAEDGNGYFSKHAMGITATALAVVLVLSLLWLLVFIVPPLTSTTAVTDRIVDNLLGEIQSKQQADRETIRLLLALENAAAPIRLATLQVAVATLGGFFLIIVGVLLFAAGATGVFQADAKGGGLQFGFRDLTPGVGAAILGGLLIGLGVYRDIHPAEIQYSNTPAARVPKSPKSTDVRTSQPDNIPQGSPYMTPRPQGPNTTESGIQFSP